MPYIPSPEDIDEANLVIVEFIYQVFASGFDGRILDLMDTSETYFIEMLRLVGFLDMHDDLRRLVERRGRPDQVQVR